MIRLVFVLITLCLFSCQEQTTSRKEKPQQNVSVEESSKTDQAVKDNFLFMPNQKVGAITAEAVNKSSIIEIYGEENVLDTSIYVGEGELVQGMLLFPHTTNELEIIPMPDNRTIFKVQQSSTDWHTSSGVTIGTTLQELLAINGKSFQFYGFEWDYGGTVANWNGGVLDHQNLMVRLGIEGEYEMELVGEQIIEATTPAAKNAQISVTAFSTYFE